MPEPIEPGATEPINPHVRFERKDANVRSIVLFGFVLVGMTVLTHLVVMASLAGITGTPTPAGPAAVPVGQERLRLPKNLKQVPAPRLQINQEHDLAELLRRDADLLNHYGWVDPKTDVVRIPIERAMQLLSDPKSAAAHGLHVRPEGK